jgi:ribonuclease J
MNLRIIPLGGGPGTVTSNMWVYQYGADAIIVDCGIGFPEDKVSDDILIPDITYLRTVRPRIHGLILTHGHDDHYAAVPHLIRDLGYPPVYGSRLTAALCQDKLEEFNEKTKVQVIKETDRLKLGPFTIEPIHMTHSVPDTFHYMITTPVGRVYHGSDYKIDLTPLDKWGPNLQKVAALSQPGVLCMLLDCLRSEREGVTPSETSLTPALKRELNHWGGRLIFTTMSSQIHRIQQAIDVALGYKRKICFIGRSTERTSQIARELGFLRCPQKEIIKPKEIKRFKDHQLCLIISGSQGQESSSLTRYAAGRHKVLKARPTDKVIYSTDIIPGNEQAVYKVIDQLSRLGLSVVYQETTGDLHVSGHAAAVEQQLMMELVNPRYLYPIGGSFRHMYRFKHLAGQLGFEDKQCLLPETGQVVEFSEAGQATLGEVIKLQLPRFNQNG